MATDTTLVAETRKASGSGAARRLRREGKLPGIIYGAGQAPRAIALNAHDFEQMMRYHHSDNVIMTLTLDGAPETVLLREIQRDSQDGHVIHVDFVTVNMTETLHISVTIELVGESVGVSRNGGMLDQLIREIEVACLPADVIEQIDVDVSGLDVGESILVKDLPIDSKLTVLTDGDVAVASVLAPRVEKAEGNVEEAGEAAAEETAAQ